MSRRRTVRQMEDEVDFREAVIEALLDELCVTLGFCLPPDEKAALRMALRPAWTLLPRQ